MHEWFLGANGVRMKKPVLDLKQAIEDREIAYF
jgi:hypothetical protein